MKQLRNIVKIFVVATASLLVGCLNFDDEFENYNTSTEGCIELNFVPQNMEALAVGTRAVDAKVDEETALNDVHIFIFDKNSGEQFYYHHLSSDANENTQSDIINPFDDQYSGISMATVFVVANFESGYIDISKAEQLGYQISDLQNTYKPNSFNVTRLPDNGMPMIGSTDIDWEQLRQTNSVIARRYDVKMYALLARLDFIISLNSSEQDATGTYPQMTLTKFGLYNIPNQTIAVEANSEALTEIGESNYFDQETTHYQPTISNNHGEIRVSLYMFDNKRGVYTDYSYPDGIEGHPNDKQRYKPLIAENKGLTNTATYFKFSAKFWDYNGVAHDVTYTLYAGANNTDNFNIRRNHQYKCNVKISGIKTHDGLEGNTLDARVEMEESNPFYLSILQERSIDAHFAVIPVDIFLADPVNDEIRVEVADDGSRSIMKVQRVLANDMLVSGIRTEGRGKINYFYSDLITNYGAYGLSNDISSIKNKDRIYIYLDENISLKTRTGKLNFYYNGSTIPSYTMAIEQTGLVPVRVVNSGNLEQVVFCESFEEYLDFYDPLANYNSPNLFPGLPWATEGKDISDENAQNNYIEGKDYTAMIISDYGIAMSSLTLNGTPATAAAYCAHKNKRQSNNDVVNYKWCMPGIRQLEGVLTANYNRFAPIRDGEYYWSSATGKGIISWFDDDDRARATAAYINSDGNIDYAPSARNQDYEDAGDYHGKAGGSALRTTKLRIRAIYQPDDGDIIDGITYYSNDASANEKNFITDYPH